MRIAWMACWRCGQVGRWLDTTELDSEHYELMCRKCGQVMHLPMGAWEERMRRVFRDPG